MILDLQRPSLISHILNILFSEECTNQDGDNSVSTSLNYLIQARCSLCAEELQSLPETEGKPVESVSKIKILFQIQLIKYSINENRFF